MLQAHREHHQAKALVAGAPVHLPSRCRRAGRALALAAVIASASIAVLPARAADPKKAPPPADSKAESPKPDVPANDPRAEARAHFERGLQLIGAGSWEAALAEFLATRRLAPTIRNATLNAARCLQKLDRTDEALAMYETLLRDFPDLPNKEKEGAQREVLALRTRVGTIELSGAEPGAAITINGRARGEYPPLEPLRVTAGSHIVRVYKEGFEAFEARVDVAGAATVNVIARQVALARAGRLSVAESDGRATDVVIDGNVVGRTPWSGPVPAGQHTVLLRGDDDLGTQPASVRVELSQNVALKLTAERLAAEVRIEPQPAGGVIAIDGVTVGRGLWAGRLREGAHTIEIAAEGFVSQTRSVTLETGARQALRVTLVRDDSSPLWRKPSRVVVDFAAAFALAPVGVAGDIGETCTAGCSSSLGLGVHGTLSGGYELGSGIGFGASLGYMMLQQSLEDRPTRLAIRDTSGPASGVSGDVLFFQGFSAGLWAGLRRGDRLRIAARIGAGGVFGVWRDTRTGTFFTTSSQQMTLREASTLANAADVYIAPDLRLGLALTDHLELTAGAGALIVLRTAPLRWVNPPAGVYADVSDQAGYFGTFPEEKLVSDVVVAVTPSIGIRYDF